MTPTFWAALGEAVATYIKTETNSPAGRLNAVFLVLSLAFVAIACVPTALVLFIRLTLGSAPAWYLALPFVSFAIFLIVGSMSFVLANNLPSDESQ